MRSVRQIAGEQYTVRSRGRDGGIRSATAITDNLDGTITAEARQNPAPNVYDNYNGTVTTVPYPVTLGFTEGFSEGFA
jgi:hypothetical protein